MAHHGHHRRRKNAKQLSTPAACIILAVCSLIGLAMACIGINMRHEQKGLEKRCTLEVKAYCLDVKVVTHTTAKSGTSKAYYPVMRYEVAGKSYTMKSESSANSEGDFVKGKWYMIKVDPDDPQTFTYDVSKQMNTLTSVLLIVIGLALAALFAGLIVLVVRSSRKQKSEVGSQRSEVRM